MIATYLEPGEQMEADDGYIGEAPLLVKCPNQKRKRRWQSRYKLVTKQRTNGSSNGAFCIRLFVMSHDIIKHCNNAAACAISQLAIENGDPLFEVHYDNLDFDMEDKEDGDGDL